MASLWQDVRFGALMLWKAPSFLALSAVTLALGIGANTAVFSVVNGVLLRALPFREPDQLLSLYWRARASPTESVPYLNFLDWQRYNHTFQSLGSYRDDDFNFLGSGDPERLHGKMISAGFFEVLGISPRLGRTFLTEEDALGARPVVVISSSFWERHFAAAANVLGRSLTLNGRDHDVVGVIAGNLLLGGPADVFVPIGQWDEKMFRERKFSFDTRVIGRLKRGVRREEAIADMDAVGRQLAAAYPDANANTGITVIALKQDLVGSFRGKLMILLGAVSFVLLIACANVGNLLLARASKRGREVAVRVALGASSFRIVRQLLTESVLLGLVGGVLGLLLAASLTRVALTALPSAIPGSHSIQIDVYVFAFALATSVLAGILFGLVPALKAGDPDLHEMLKEGGRGNSGTRHRAQSLFVVAEVSLALVLLAGAGLMIRSLARLARVDPGFDPRNVLVFRVALSPENATQPAQIRALQANPGNTGSAARRRVGQPDDGRAAHDGLFGNPLLVGWRKQTRLTK